MISFLVAEKGTYSEENLTMTKGISGGKVKLTVCSIYFLFHLLLVVSFVLIFTSKEDRVNEDGKSNGNVLSNEIKPQFFK